MPVPVPLYAKQPAHPVIKINQAADADFPKSSLFQHLTLSLPHPPPGPPPSFASREEWISSLPSWRRNKPRRIWEDDSRSHAAIDRQGFQEGLTVAGNAAVIKGAPAQACIPPVSTLLASADFATAPPPISMFSTPEEDVDDEFTLSDRVLGWQGEDDEMNVEQEEDGDAMDLADYQSDLYRSDPRRGDNGVHALRSFERGTFSPVFEETSPELGHHDPGSSPIGPATPFGEYVDRAVAAAHNATQYVAGIPSADVIQQGQYGYLDDLCGPQCYQCHRYQHDSHPMERAPVPETVVTPSATAEYKKLAEPLAEWVATFVWKVCTTGMRLPAEYAHPMALKNYSSAPPSYLAKSTHSILLSTLLQPSAIYLALWYIVHLPVFFGPTNLGEAHVREKRFRAELLGEAHMAGDRDAIESYAPFRLILLGCMLANKWLDDHTFSNKTWHTITNVPIHSINKLESLALDLFAHDLSIQPADWSHWLSQMLAYHLSLSSPTCLQPISRPSASPHTIVRKSIESLVRASASMNDEVCATPQPFFLGADEAKKEDFDRGQEYEEDIDVLEIDLDEDGPLREEYLPRRRVSAAGSTRHLRSREKIIDADRLLPPPARWSPAADEPIIRDDIRPHARYMAPQPIQHVAPPAPQPPFHQAVDVSRRIWPVGGYAPKQEMATRQAYPLSSAFNVQPSYAGYDYPYAAPLAHVRSQSLTYNLAAAPAQPSSHFRSYSQSRFDGGYSDVRFTEARYPPAHSHWSHFDRPRYPGLYDGSFDFQQQPSLKA